MLYTKPEITDVASAVNAVQSTTKPDCTHADTISTRPVSLTAYEADE
jgi:hypothetical protein